MGWQSRSWKTNVDAREGRRKIVRSYVGDGISQFGSIWEDWFCAKKAWFTLEKGWWLMKPAVILWAGHSWEPGIRSVAVLWSRSTPQEEETQYRNLNSVHWRTWAELLALLSVELMHGACWHLFVIWNLCNQGGLVRPNDALETSAIRVKLIPVLRQISHAFIFNISIKCYDRVFQVFPQNNLRAGNYGCTRMLECYVVRILSELQDIGFVIFIIFWRLIPED